MGGPPGARRQESCKAEEGASESGNLRPHLTRLTSGIGAHMRHLSARAAPTLRLSALRVRGLLEERAC